MDQEVVDEIRYLVQREVTGFQEFTAWNITQALRRQNIRGWHSDFKQVVHQMFEDGEMKGYARKLKDFGGAEDAWVYHYAGVPYMPSPGKFPSGTKLGGNQILPDNNTPEKVEARSDLRGTVCIPARVVRSAGFVPGDVVEACSQPNQQTLAVILWDGRVVDNSAAVSLYTVDKYCNIRITQSVMYSAGLTGIKFNVCANSTSKGRTSGEILMTTA